VQGRRVLVTATPRQSCGATRRSVRACWAARIRSSPAPPRRRPKAAPFRAPPTDARPERWPPNLTRYAVASRNPIAVVLASFSLRRNLAVATPLGCVVLAAVAACGPESTRAPDTGADAGACSHPPDTGFQPGESVASGSITSPNVSALVCDLVVSASSPASGGSTPDQAFVSFGMSGQYISDVQRPTGATSVLMQGTLQVGALRPGVYSNSDGLCGAVYYSYSFALVPSAHCEGGTTPNCPAGCAPACTDAGCASCVQFQSGLEYQASAASNCLASTLQQVMGSWTLDLNSVVPVRTVSGIGETIYSVHGSLTADLVNPQVAIDTSPAGAGILANEALERLVRCGLGRCDDKLGGIHAQLTRRPATGGHT
jgi:hypothetical protein